MPSHQGTCCHHHLEEKRLCINRATVQLTWCNFIVLMHIMPSDLSPPCKLGLYFKNKSINRTVNRYRIGSNWISTGTFLEEFLHPLFPDRIGVWSSEIFGGRKTRKPKENLWAYTCTRKDKSQKKKKLNLTLTPGSRPHRLNASALTTACHLCSPEHDIIWYVLQT